MKTSYSTEGMDVRPAAGRLVRPDGWSWAMPLTVSEWEGADFRINSARYADVSRAVNVKVTGRTVRNGMVRVSLEWVGDGEPSEFTGGFMQV